MPGCRIGDLIANTSTQAGQNWSSFRIYHHEFEKSFRKPGFDTSSRTFPIRPGESSAVKRTRDQAKPALEMAAVSVRGGQTSLTSVA